VYEAAFAIFAALTVVLAAPFAYLGLITLAALRWPATPAFPWAAPPRFLVVIPAHEEEAGIGATVASCLAADYPPGRFAVCVIADNCSDRTAAVARAAGAQVVTRRDPGRRGKGHALGYLFNADVPGVDMGGYDAAVVVDADSILDPRALSAFAAALAEGGEWLQAYNIVGNPDESRRTRLLAYAFGLINGVHLLGQQGLGMGVGLRGNGMCLATSALARVSWREHGLAEDAEFSWVLRTLGERARFVPGAVVRSAMLARSGPGAEAQRGRWEWGRRALPGRFLGPLLRAPRLGLRLKALYLVDLLCPPMVTLLLLWGVALTPHLGAALDDRLSPLSRGLLPAHALMAAALGIYTLSPVLVIGMPARYLLCLLDLPYYAAWKLGVALKGRPAGWTRTPREHRRARSGLAEVAARPNFVGD